ncbi:exodeoxyribonuclease VII large subunit [Anaerosolibacter carboniphilus]|uniref:Exodeoxyribonuclease 7 large subunit n=1 Tax=Anaerosolibacter carboniphilus TaxID=1417629 RepID=A0A841KT89_9FIRM|nr:exodeoxyribonuclease VII large subunit [Anaerosolibacter carboniphilus]MBB6216631.1 exodeoxyribonuclease VII large subunit [Anaerosolibacter carboniphilus]
MKLRALSVSELNKYIKRIIGSDPILNNIHLKGEVSNFKIHSSGHAYFSLKDDKSKINCIMFRDDVSKVKYRITEGLNVIVKGYVSTYERDGLYQLYVHEIEPEGLGSLYLALQQLKEKLEEEGLFDRMYKKNIPSFPKKIAVITSLTGAAIRDILSIIQRRNPTIHVVIIPVTVQGEAAGAEISHAIGMVNHRDDIDVIILGRGGGSIEELWAFNEEVVARSIFSSQIPIISAVGHETDYTISDLVADLRAPTPSAAAELAVPMYRDIKNHLDMYMQYMHISLNKFLKEKRSCLEKCDELQLERRLRNKLREEKQHLDITFSNLQIQSKRMIDKSRSALTGYGHKLDVLNPFATLRRGYSITLDHSNRKVITSIEKIKVGDDINIMLTNGEVLCKVTDVVREEINFENTEAKQ